MAVLDVPSAQALLGKDRLRRDRGRGRPWRQQRGPRQLGPCRGAHRHTGADRGCGSRREQGRRLGGARHPSGASSWPSPASPCSSARSSSSTPCPSPSPSAPASWRPFARSAPHVGRSAARSSSRGGRRVGGSAVGLLAGIGLARGLNALFKTAGVDLPHAATVIAPRTFFVSILVGTLVTVLASLVPAIRATRVPPIAAVREGAVLSEARSGRRRSLAPLAGVVGVGLTTWSVLGSLGTRPRLLLMAAGPRDPLRRRRGAASPRRGSDRPGRRRSLGPPGRGGRAAGPRERRAKPRTHRCDVGGAHGRHRAHHPRRIARSGAPQRRVRRPAQPGDGNARDCL